jgi:two-component system, LytTR family, response regulator
MDKIKTILVDDEEHNRQLLKQMLAKYCPQIEVIAESENANDAFIQVTDLNPDLVFLDIKMPEKSGFQFLRMFTEIEFMIIFVTGYDEFSLRAFEFNALDYILKPIDYTKLQIAVERVSKLHLLKQTAVLYKQAQQLDGGTSNFKKIAVHTADSVVFVDISDIKYLEAASSYCKIVLNTNKTLMTSKLLGDYENLFSIYSSFMRISKSHIINLDYIHSYSKGLDCEIKLNDTEMVFEVSRRRKTEVVAKLKEMKVK